MFIVMSSLVCFTASGFWYTINTAPSLKLLDIPLLSGVMESLKPWFSKTRPFILWKVLDGVDDGMSQCKAQDEGLVGS